MEEMQRRRLLVAICELLGEEGLDGVSVGSISKRAGVSRRTFYEVFEDREDCLLAAFNQATERIAREIAPAYEREGSWNTRVRAALTALLEHFDAHPGVGWMCVVETLKAGPELLERRRIVLAALVEAVEKGRAYVKHGNEPLPLTAEGVVGGALAVLHARLLASSASERGDPRAERSDPGLLSELANPLTAMVVHPYLGAAVARRELERPSPKAPGVIASRAKDPFRGLSIRFTYRTARVLETIAADPGTSNRLIADSSGIGDEGQMSRLLRRLEGAGLIENRGEGHIRGAPNEWWLTSSGEVVHATLAGSETS